MQKEDVRKIKCPVCGKEQKIKHWKSTSGILKGQTICENVFCSPICKDIFKAHIELSDIQEIKEVGKQVEGFLNTDYDNLKKAFLEKEEVLQSNKKKSRGKNE